MPQIQTNVVESNIAEVSKSNKIISINHDNTDQKQPQAIPFVDEWQPNDNEKIFTHNKNILIAPISNMFKVDNEQINFFLLNMKKSYNSEDLRNHLCHYMNYFEKYFDPELEYFTNLGYMKFFIDCYPEYRKDRVLYDINRYILQPSLVAKAVAMVDYNYSLTLSYKSLNNPQLQYTDEHAKLMLKMSIMMNMCIPIITHFGYIKRVDDIDELILDVYDAIFHYPDFIAEADIYQKLFQTALSNVKKNEKNNAVIWAKQDIRGKDIYTHALGAVQNIMVNIMPKYSFSQNMISLNYTSIQKNNKYQVTDIMYELNYVQLNSAAGDNEDAASDLDKFEANLIKVNEALYLQAKINCQETMKKIEKLYGPFDEEEINFYRRELRNDNGEIMNGFQKQMIFNLFYKYFVDTQSINAINSTDYIKLMISAKRMLQKSNMVFLPYIISGKPDKIVSRKSLNKKEYARMEESQNYQAVVDKYKNDKITKMIFGTIATIVTSEFRVIDFDKTNNTPRPSCSGDNILHAGPAHAKIINVETDIIIEECLLYILLI